MKIQIKAVFILLIIGISMPTSLCVKAKNHKSSHKNSNLASMSTTGIGRKIYDLIGKALGFDDSCNFKETSDKIVDGFSDFYKVVVKVKESMKSKLNKQFTSLKNLLRSAFPRVANFIDSASKAKESIERMATNTVNKIKDKFKKPTGYSTLVEEEDPMDEVEENADITIQGEDEKAEAIETAKRNMDGTITEVSGLLQDDEEYGFKEIIKQFKRMEFGHQVKNLIMCRLNKTQKPQKKLRTGANFMTKIAKCYKQLLFFIIYTVIVLLVAGLVIIPVVSTQLPTVVAILIAVGVVLLLVIIIPAIVIGIRKLIKMITKNRDKIDA